MRGSNMRGSTVLLFLPSEVPNFPISLQLCKIQANILYQALLSQVAIHRGVTMILVLIKEKQRSCRLLWKRHLWFLQNILVY